MMEDAAINAARPVGFRRPHASVWRACWIQTASPSSWDPPSVCRARTFICSTCLRHSTTGSSLAAGALDGKPVLVAAQEGQFMGGTFAEVSGAKTGWPLEGGARSQGPARRPFCC